MKLTPRQQALLEQLRPQNLSWPVAPWGSRERVAWLGVVAPLERMGLIEITPQGPSQEVARITPKGINCLIKQQRRLARAPIREAARAEKEHIRRAPMTPAVVEALARLAAKGALNG